MPFIRSTYNYDTNQASIDSGLECKDPTRTQQHFKEETDINTIVKRFNLTGQLPTDIRMPQYADFDQAFDFHTAMNAIRQAQEAFDAMPADIRARFHNDPGEFVDFTNDRANLPEAIKMGLVERPLAPSPTPQATPQVTPTASTTPPEGLQNRTADGQYATGTHAPVPPK